MERVSAVLAMPAPERWDHFDDAIEAFYEAARQDRERFLVSRATRPLRVEYQRRRMARRRRSRRG